MGDRMNRSSGRVDPIFDRSFGWLRQLGFTATDDSLGNVVLAASFSTDEVVVRASYEWRDSYADITVARRWKQPESAPFAWTCCAICALTESLGSMEPSVLTGLPAGSTGSTANAGAAVARTKLAMAIAATGRFTGCLLDSAESRSRKTKDGAASVDAERTAAGALYSRGIPAV